MSLILQALNGKKHFSQALDCEKACGCKAKSPPKLKNTRIIMFARRNINRTTAAESARQKIDGYRWYNA
ncbi:MAG: hypothetical protein LBP22_15110 [Deltaproteobacteria bacterium]|nr:hypothetical protein [Deltaproteobacteria bacterium]